LAGAEAPARSGFKTNGKEKYMNRIAFLALLVGGIVLIVIGVNATNSFSSDVSRFFTGSATDKAMWMLVAGIIAAIIGLTGTLHSSKQV
jgi:uncharacterized protein DUF3185